MKWIAGVIGAAIGLVAGYYAVAYAGCIWFWPESNLCGILGVPVGLAGAVGGFMLGFRVSR
jgi:hypothetical protein